ncbi:branched-chain amino acid ABC transporter permease [bacterium]|nr:branched-chain amino acid ABC transporter permease [bacterium]
MINEYIETIIILIMINSIFALSLNLIIGFNGQFSLGHAAFLAIGAYASAIVVAAYNFPFLIGLFVAGVMAAVLGLVIGVPTLRLRGDYLAIATLGFAEITKMVLLIMPEKIFGGATGIPGGAKEIDKVPQLSDLLRMPGAIAPEFAGKLPSQCTGAAPVNINQTMNLIFCFVWIIATLIVVGYGFYALYRWLKGTVERRISGKKWVLWSLRLVYWGGLIVLAVTNTKRINDSFYGVFGVHRSHTWNSYLSTQWTVFLFLIVAVLLITWLCVNYLRSTYGRAVIAIREDEIASTMLGIGEFKFKLMNFLVGTFFAGVAGGLLAHSIPSFNPFEFDLLKSVDALLMVVLGGMGSITGTFFGATVLTILPEALRQSKEWRMVIYSLTLVLLMIFKPKGFFGSSEFSPKIPDFLRRLMDNRRGAKGASDA